MGLKHGREDIMERVLGYAMRLLMNTLSLLSRLSYCTCSTHPPLLLEVGHAARSAASQPVSQI